MDHRLVIFFLYKSPHFLPLYIAQHGSLTPAYNIVWLSWKTSFIKFVIFVIFFAVLLTHINWFCPHLGSVIVSLHHGIEITSFSFFFLLNSLLTLQVEHVFLCVPLWILILSCRHCCK